MTKKIKVPPHTELREDSQSFERFEHLAKALIAVPKKELDKELAKHERKKTDNERKKNP